MNAFLTSGGKGAWQAPATAYQCSCPPLEGREGCLEDARTLPACVLVQWKAGSHERRDGGGWLNGSEKTIGVWEHQAPHESRRDRRGDRGHQAKVVQWIGARTAH